FLFPLSIRTIFFTLLLHNDHRTFGAFSDFMPITTYNHFLQNIPSPTPNNIDIHFITISVVYEHMTGLSIQNRRLVGNSRSRYNFFYTFNASLPLVAYIFNIPMVQRL